MTDVEQLDDVLRVEEQVNGGDFRWLKKRMIPHFDIPGYLSVYVGYLEGRPVSTGWIYFHPGSQFGGLFGGATLEEFRGQGWYTAILQRRILEAAERGRNFVVVDAGAMSRPILVRHGFQHLTVERDFVWPMGERGLTLTAHLGEQPGERLNKRFDILPGVISLDRDSDQLFPFPIDQRDFNPVFIEEARLSGRSDRGYAAVGRPPSAGGGSVDARFGFRNKQ